ncbi:MAG: acyl-CoA thioesterase [Verrucomicrobiales bacterium]
MITHRLVLPEDLNQYGYLFGGRLLAWIDEASWIAATLERPACRFVTIGMEQASFHRSVREGSILEIEATEARLGRTSSTYQVTVRDRKHHGDDPIFSTRVTFVNIDEQGQKQPIASP